MRLFLISEPEPLSEAWWLPSYYAMHRRLSAERLKTDVITGVPWARVETTRGEMVELVLNLATMKQLIHAGKLLKSDEYYVEVLTTGAWLSGTILEAFTFQIADILELTDDIQLVADTFLLASLDARMRALEEKNERSTASSRYRSETSPAAATNDLSAPSRKETLQKLNSAHGTLEEKTERSTAFSLNAETSPAAARMTSVHPDGDAAAASDPIPSTKAASRVKGRGSAATNTNHLINPLENMRCFSDRPQRPPKAVSGNAKTKKGRPSRTAHNDILGQDSEEMSALPALRFLHQEDSDEGQPPPPPPDGDEDDVDEILAQLERAETRRLHEA
jgi:hypothetical protein